MTYTNMYQENNPQLLIYLFLLLSYTNNFKCSSITGKSVQLQTIDIFGFLSQKSSLQRPPKNVSCYYGHVPPPQ